MRGKSRVSVAHPMRFALLAAFLLVLPVLLSAAETPVSRTTTTTTTSTTNVGKGSGKPSSSSFSTSSSSSSSSSSTNHAGASDTLLTSASSSISRKSSDFEISISDINLLLPFTFGKNKIERVLEAFNGCFTWTSSNPDVIRVEAVHDSPLPESFNPFTESQKKVSCSNKVRVIVETNVPRRASSWIIAEDKETGKKLKCEAYVDLIHQVEIATTTRTMYTDDVEVVQIQATDSEGNMFSTLEGLNFKWSIAPLTPNNNNVIRFISFDASAVDVSAKVLHMEREGLQSSQVLVQGTECGRAQVTATITEPGYASVAAHKVLISVLEPLQLDPSGTTYITKGGSMRYKLITYKQNVMKYVDMPNSQYAWKTALTSIATVDQTGLLNALAIGSTFVSVHYENMNENSIEAEVVVCVPASISIRIESTDQNSNFRVDEASSANWILVAGREYKLEVEVFDDQKHKIFVGDDASFELNLPSKYFKILMTNPSRSQLTVRALVDGITKISASLLRPNRHLDLPSAISTTRDVEITLPVSVKPAPYVLLPFVPLVSHRYTLRASGGSGSYGWYSSDDSVVNVNQRGEIYQIPSHHLPSSGNWSTVMAVDRLSLENRDATTVILREPAAIEFYGRISSEIELGNRIRVFVRVLDDEGRPFHNCSALNIQWAVDGGAYGDSSVLSITDDATLEIDNDFLETQAASCSYTTIRAHQEGQATLIASILGLSTSKTFFVFKSLTLLQPETGMSLVTLGSSDMIVAVGGPNPWQFEPNAFFSEITSSKASAVHITKADQPTRGGNKNAPTSSRLYSYRVTCLTEGEVELTVRVGNKATVGNPFPVSQSVTSIFSCQLPTQAIVYPVVPKPKDICKSDPAFQSLSEETIKSAKIGGWTSGFKLRSDQILPFRLALLDHRGYVFSNFSSLAVSWSIESGTHLVKILPGLTACKQECNIDIGPSEGVAAIKVRVDGYDEKFLRSPIPISHNAKNFDATLTKSVDITLINNVRFNVSRQISLLNHPDNQLHLTTLGGSGFHSISFNNSALVELISPPNPLRRNFTLVPRVSGPLLVTVSDQCLSGSTDSHATVYVSEIGHLAIKADDIQELGSTRSAQIIAFDENNQPFPLSEYSLMELNLVFDHSILHFEETTHPSSTVSLEVFHKPYLVTGLQIGTSQVSASTKQFGKQVTSASVSVTVYPPFQLKPREDLYLLVGTSYQIETTGGPSFGASVSFRTDSNEIAKVDAFGNIQALRIGSTKLTGELRRDTDESVQGVDSITVHVISFSGVKIHSASNSLVAGNEMTLMAMGEKGETPFTFYHPGLQFRWESSNSDVVELLPIYEEAGVTLGQEASFSVRARAKKSGTSRISLEMVNPGWKSNAQTNIRLFVSEVLDIVGPSTLLLPPGVAAKISTTLDAKGSLSYSVLGNCDSANANGNTNGPQSIRIASNGEVESLRPGTSYVVIEDPETGQSVSAKVVVKMPQKLEIALIHSTDSQPQYHIAMGTSNTYEIRLKDERGFQFTHFEYDVAFVTNNQEVVSISKISDTTFRVNGVRPGEVILKVSCTTDSNLQDFLKLQVGNAIFPTNALVHRGGTVQFNTKHKESPSLKDGVQVASTTTRWISGEPEVLVINPATGLGTAGRQGQTKVSFLSNSIVESSTVVKVIEVNTILTKKQSSSNDFKCLSNAKPNAVFKFPFVSFHDSLQLDPFIGNQSAVIDHNIAYSCKVLESQYASAKFYRLGEESNGEIGCQISIYPTSAFLRVSLPSSLTLQITASDQFHSYAHTSTEPIAFCPIFAVHSNMMATNNTISLTPSVSYTTLEVKHGRAMVVVVPPDFVSTIRVAKTSEDYQTATTLFMLDVIDRSHPFTTTITVIDGLTSHQEEITVQYTKEEPKVSVVAASPLSRNGNHHPSSGELQYHADNLTYVSKRSGSSFFTLLLINIIILAVIIFFYFLFRNNNNSLSPASSAVAATPMKPGL